jgi:multimeric flavodoxin WrbA
MLIIYSMEIPPKGCLLLVEAILAGASEKGAETRLVNLRELNIQERR